jgi:hypothetical protein
MFLCALITQREQDLEKKENVLNQNSLGSASWRTFLVILLSVEALLEKDPNEF